MREWLKLAAPLLLAVQALAVHSAASGERPPAVPDLQRLPAEFGNWKLFRRAPVEEAFQAELRADALLNRGYFDSVSGLQADLFVAWFQSQSRGNRQPHSPKVCLPGSGWIPRESGDVAIETSAGPVRASQYLVSKGGERSAVVYWYQTPRRAIAGEWEAKFWVALDALRDHRTDAALVRVVVPCGNKTDKQAADAAVAFARDVYPAVRTSLPR